MTTNEKAVLALKQFIRDHPEDKILGFVIGTHDGGVGLVWGTADDCTDIEDMLRQTLNTCEFKTVETKDTEIPS